MQSELSELETETHYEKNGVHPSSECILKWEEQALDINAKIVLLTAELPNAPDQPMTKEEKIEFLITEEIKKESDLTDEIDKAEFGLEIDDALATSLRNKRSDVEEQISKLSSYGLRFLGTPIPAPTIAFDKISEEEEWFDKHIWNEHD